jgi:hypothetical protein
MSVIFISTCTGSKTLPLTGSICADDLENGSIREVCKSWKKLVRLSEPKIPANELYCGRGFKDAKKTAELLNADHWIISAGLGLIRADKKVPVYDLTLKSQGRSNLKPKINGQAFRATKWWKELNLQNKYKNIAELVEEFPRSKIIIAISTPYYHMILEDIANIPHSDSSRIRLIGPNLPRPNSDSRNALLLPYGERLDGPRSPIKGTKSDFAQRAGLHFATYVWPSSKNRSFATHSEKIIELLKVMGTPKKIVNKKISDEEVEKIILANWEKCQGYSSVMLRILRDELKIACEQSRFKNIFNQLKIQREL